jgi:hypothetical protein
MGLIFFLPGAIEVMLSPVFFLHGLADQFIRLWI